MYKVLKIELSEKTSSKSLSEALRLSKKLNAITEGEIITIDLTLHEVFNLWEYVNALLNIIDKWKSFEYVTKGLFVLLVKNTEDCFMHYKKSGNVIIPT